MKTLGGYKAMNKSKVFYKMYYQVNNLINKGDGSKWVDVDESIVFDLLIIRRLAKKHHRLAEMGCNGVGYVKGSMYYNGTIDDYARREYGSSVKSAYLSDDLSIFDVESGKIEDKIKDIASRLGFSVEFQGDPRGNTVKLYADSTKTQWININD